MSEFDDVLISIDTLKPSIAKAAVENGADLINDTSGNSLGMLELGVNTPIIIMHKRGNSKTM